MTQELICSSCGHRGKAKTITRGSFLVEIILWLLFLIPGLLYSIWRLSSRHKACWSCGSQTLIPANSPVGKKIISDYNEK